MSQNSSQHRVFLEKRTGDEQKGDVVTCSICGDSLPGARELGVHILSAHCDVYQQQEAEDSVMIEGSPGLSMEVEVDPLEPTSRPEPTQSLEEEEKEGNLSTTVKLPRAPTANEMKQKFMIYRISETSNRYICLACDKVYTSRYNIRMHMNLHNGTNVHTCQFCGRQFAHKHVFESHVRTHTGERPFACDKCGRRFGDRSNCASHSKRCGGMTGTDKSPEPEVKGESINIAPNVSLTPIKKLKSEVDDNLLKTEKNEAEQDDPLRLTFAPQIVSVQSISCKNNNDDFVNMGYVGDDDDDEASEEMMIEPDISLDYDDIEDIADQSEKDSEGFAQDDINSELTCSFCNAACQDQNSLLEHLTVHVDIPHKPVQAETNQGYMTLYTSARPKFMCLYCGKFFVTSENVSVHVKVHVEDKIYPCSICGKVFQHKHLYDNHRKVVHSLPVRQEHTCDICNHVFPSAVSLINHTRNCSHKQPDPVPDNNVNNNNQLEQKKKNKANRPPPKLILLNNSNTNLITKNLAEGSDHIIIQKSASTSLDEFVKKPITIAPKPTVSLLSEEAKRIFQNSAPSPKSMGGSNPRAHKIVETPAGREYIPDTNSNNIVNLASVYPPPGSAEVKRGFMLRPCGPGGQQRFVCVECGKHYTTSYNVRMHRNIHLGKNLYSCKFCKKEFSHKHVWETHERVHTGERPFKCPTCPKDFADRSNYNSHKKICLRLQQQNGGVLLHT